MSVLECGPVNVTLVSKQVLVLNPYGETNSYKNHHLSININALAPVSSTLIVRYSFLLSLLSHVCMHAHIHLYTDATLSCSFCPFCPGSPWMTFPSQPMYPDHPLRSHGSDDTHSSVPRLS